MLQVPRLPMACRGRLGSLARWQPPCQQGTGSLRPLPSPHLCAGLHLSWVSNLPPILLPISLLWKLCDFWFPFFPFLYIAALQIYCPILSYTFIYHEPPQGSYYWYFGIFLSKLMKPVNFGAGEPEGLHLSIKNIFTLKRAFLRSVLS